MLPILLAMVTSSATGEDPSTSPTTTSGAWLQSLDRDSRAATDLVLRSATNKQWNGVVTAIDQCAGRVFVSGLGVCVCVCVCVCVFYVLLMQASLVV